MEPLIFRNDDVSPNTDRNNLYYIYRIILENFNAEIISGVTVLSGRSNNGAVYQDVPFKDKDLSFFYNVERAGVEYRSLPGKIASHGLIHFDHSAVNYDVQKMSIISSCNYLNTDLFIPPFNRWNEDTKDICDKNGIKIMCGPEWKGLEFNEFNQEHKKWSFHSWKWNPGTFKLKVLRPGTVITKHL